VAPCLIKRSSIRRLDETGSGTVPLLTPRERLRTRSPGGESCDRGIADVFPTQEETHAIAAALQLRLVVGSTIAGGTHTALAFSTRGK
jgi:hypothetical protein